MEATQKAADIISIDCKKNTMVPLSTHVKSRINLYFAQLNGHDAVNLYAMVIGEVERPLLEATLEHTGYNQSKAAKALGLSRSTLRKKLEYYGIG
jgi:Fis family transcriptional regulator, factor for inversion stimulation protein